MAKILAAAVLAVLGITSTLSAQPAAPALDAVLQKTAAYVSTYGEKASMFVGVEKYTQSVTVEGMAGPNKPRQLIAEFVIIKAPAGGGWIGFRDVVDVEGKPISDRRDRLVSILTDEAADSGQVTKLANESARYNIGPISRNFNVPTSALFFFQPDNLARFTFTRKGTKKIEGAAAVEIDFKETRSPTLIMTRAGKDVPLEGTLWVVPEDGTIVQTRLKMRNFADQMTSPVQGTPMGRTGNTVNGGQEARNSISDQSLNWSRIDSEADIEVTYRRDDALGVWLPVKMTELYAGPLAGQPGKPPTQGRATTRATYSDFKQFGTSVKINAPK